MRKWVTRLAPGNTYGKVMANNGHGPTNAFARPLARKKLAGG
jgi:hypothetical protein